MRVKAISGHPVLKSHACLSPRRGKVPSRCQWQKKHSCLSPRRGKVPSRCQRQKKHSCLSPRRGEVSRSDGEGPLLTEGLSPDPQRLSPLRRFRAIPPLAFGVGKTRNALQAEPRGYFSLDICRNSHYNKQALRGVAQLVARMVRDHEAASSSLATPTKKDGPPNGGPSFLVGVARTLGLRPHNIKPCAAWFGEKRPAAAGGRRRQAAFCAAVEKHEELRKPEVFFAFPQAGAKR